VRLHVLQADAFSCRDTGDGRNLIENKVLGLARCHGHLAAAEPCEIGESRVGADRHAAIPGQPDGRAQNGGVAAVESCGNARRGDRLQQIRIVADGIGAERLADVGVEIHPQHSR
jgi:hypothetical protein